MVTTPERTEADILLDVEDSAAQLRWSHPELTKEAAFVRVLSEDPGLRRALAKARRSDQIAAAQPVEDAFTASTRRIGEHLLKLSAHEIRQRQPGLSEAQAVVLALKRHPDIAKALRGR